MTVEIARRVVVEASLVEVRQRVRAVLASLDGVVLVDSDDRFEAQTARSMRSFGERLSVEATPVDGGTSVVVHAASLLSTTVYDFGATRRVADAVVAGITAAEPPVPIERGQPVVDPRWRWAGVALCGILAALALLPSAAAHRREVLVVAAVSAALWTVAVLTGSISVRRRGVVAGSPWAQMVPLVSMLIVGLPVADGLVPLHSS